MSRAKDEVLRNLDVASKALNEAAEGMEDVFAYLSDDEQEGEGGENAQEAMQLIEDLQTKVQETIALVDQV